MNCTTSKGYLLTFDCDVIAEKGDIYHKDSDCKNCSLEQKKQCEQKLYNILKEFPESKKEVDKDSILDINKHLNGEFRKDKFNKKRS